ncbi:MAG: ATP-binding cassette domain-containing protein [Nocardioides sp.]
MTDIAIRTEALVKRYGRDRGLDGLDLEVACGEVYGFVGPNGAGKTTTIRLLLDLLRPTSGTVEVLGQPPRPAGVALRRRIGYLPGDFVVNGRQSGAELLGHLAQLRGGFPPGGSPRWPTGSTSTWTGASAACPRATGRSSGCCRPGCTPPSCWCWTSRPAAWTRSCSRSSSPWSGGAGRRADRLHVLPRVERGAARVRPRRLRPRRADGRRGAGRQLRERAVRRVEIAFEGADDQTLAREFGALPGVGDVAVDGGVLRCRLAGRADPLVRAAAMHTVVSLLAEEPGLEELFLEYYHALERALGGDADGR